MSSSKRCLSVRDMAGVVTSIFPCRKAPFADARPRSHPAIRWIRAKVKIDSIEILICSTIRNHPAP